MINPLRIVRWHVWLLLLIALFSSACVSQKKLYEMGKQQMEVGLYDEATETLIKALNKKKSNVEVQLVLRNCATVVLEQKTDYMAESYQNNQLEEVIQNYNYLLSLQNRAQKVGVVVDLPVRAVTYFKQSREAVNEKRLINAQSALTEKNYSLAEKLFLQILSLDPNHSEASKGLTIALKQPILDKALELYERKLYRTAYGQFAQIGNYKNAPDMLALCLERGSAKYLFVPEEPIEDIDFKAMMDEFKKSRKSPFFAPVSFTEYAAWLRKYNIAFRDLYSFTSATKALYDVEKVNAIVHLSHFNNRVQKAVISRKRCRGYHEKVEEVVLKDGSKERKVSYKKVYYTIVSTSKPQEVSSFIAVRMVNAQDGTILLNKEFSRIHQDEFQFIEYDGDVKQLRAGEWSSLNLPFLSSKDRVYMHNHSDNQLIRSLRSANRTLADPNRVLTEQRINIRSEIVNQIISTTLSD